MLYNLLQNLEIFNRNLKLQHSIHFYFFSLKRLVFNSQFFSHFFTIQISFNSKYISFHYHNFIMRNLFQILFFTIFIWLCKRRLLKQHVLLYCIIASNASLAIIYRRTKQLSSFLINEQHQQKNF